ncbi:MAG: EF-hand domain-containing protein [Planctomycetaceae bacterium]
MRRPMLILLVLVLAAPALADAVDDVLRVWDANANGVLERDEVPDKEIFAKVDADADGTVTRAELSAYLGIKQDPAPKSGDKPAADPARKPETKTEEAPRPMPRSLKDQVKDFFERFDADKDGRIVTAEFRAGEEVFKQYDKNRNDSLSEREVEAYLADRIAEAKRNPRPDSFFELFDLNGDGKVTRREYDGPRAFFRLYDHNKDDTVTEAELNAGPDGGMMRMDPSRMETDGPTPLPQRTLLERYDKDGDGRVTLEELGGAENILRRLDRNGDGVLSGNETR